MDEPTQNTSVSGMPSTEEVAEQQPRERHPVRLTVIIAAILIVVIAGFTYYLNQYLADSDGDRARSDLNSLVPTGVIESQFAGDYEAAQAALEAILNKPNLSDDERALATMAGTRLDFNLSGGNFNGILSDIQEFKEIFLNQDVDISLRVRALNGLATAYCTSGRDARAFQEIYKEAPFSEYLAPGDPDLSARNLAEWSYGIRPTSFAAVRIARWYAEKYWQSFGSGSTIDEATREIYYAEAEKYLQEGARLVEAELEASPVYAMNVEHYAYRFWRARVMGWLARGGREPYKSGYAQEYESMLEYVRNGSTIARDNLYFGRHYYATTALVVDDNQELARTQLDLLAAELKAEPNPRAVVYVRFLMNEYNRRYVNDLGRRVRTPSAVNIRRMMGVSGDFRATLLDFRRGATSTTETMFPADTLAFEPVGR